VVLKVFVVLMSFFLFFFSLSVFVFYSLQCFGMLFCSVKLKINQ